MSKLPSIRLTATQGAALLITQSIRKGTKTQSLKKANHSAHRRGLSAKLSKAGY
jgi:hypothetical protein